ncbi:MAG: NnrU family protein [Magnetovibrionaceae bacterium]
MTYLVLAMLLFCGSHLLLGNSNLRDPITAKLGRTGFRGLFALVALGTLGLAIWAFAEAPYVGLYDPPLPLRHITVTLMFFAFALIAFGNMPKPHGGTASGIRTITRNPVLWGVFLWAVLHMIANGDLAAWIFFGSMALLVPLGTWQLDRRLGFDDQTSNIPFAAIMAGRSRLDWRGLRPQGWLMALAMWIVVLALHGFIFGVEPVPMPW